MRGISFNFISKLFSRIGPKQDDDFVFGLMRSADLYDLQHYANCLRFCGTDYGIIFFIDSGKRVASFRHIRDGSLLRLETALDCVEGINERLGEFLCEVYRKLCVDDPASARRWASQLRSSRDAVRMIENKTKVTG